MSILRKKIIFVKRKTGFLSYNEDPKGFRTILSTTYPKNYSHLQSTLQTSNSISITATNERKQKNHKEFISSFSDGPTILSFTQLFCSSNDTAIDFFDNNEKQLSSSPFS